MCMELAIDHVVQELRSLPPDKQAHAARYIHALKEQALADRNAILEQIFHNDLSSGEIDEWDYAVQSCRKIDVESW